MKPNQNNFLPLLCTIMVLLSSEICEAHNTSNPGNNTAVITVIFDARYGEPLEQPWLLGTFDQYGNYDPRCSAGLIPMRDDGQEGDEVSGDSIWTLQLELQRTGQAVDVFVFPDNTTIDASAAMASASVVPGSITRHGPGVLRLSSVRAEKVRINVAVDDKVKSTTDDLYLKGSWNEYGANLESGWGSALRLKRSILYRDDDAPPDVWTLDTFVSLPPWEHRFLILGGDEKTPLAQMEGTFTEKHDIHLSVDRDALQTVTILFEDSAREHSQLYVIGSWDNFGKHDKRYSAGFVPMTYVESDKTESDFAGKWIAQLRLSPDNRRYSVLVYDSDHTSRVEAALSHREFYLSVDSEPFISMNNGPETAEGEDLPEYQGISYPALYQAFSMLTALALIGAFFFLIHRRLKLRKELAIRIFDHLDSNLIMVMQDHTTVSRIFLFYIVREWKKKLAARCLIISSRMPEKGLEDGETADMATIAGKVENSDLPDILVIDSRDIPELTEKNVSLDSIRIYLRRLAEYVQSRRMKAIIYCPDGDDLSCDKMGMPGLIVMNLKDVEYARYTEHDLLISSRNQNVEKKVLINGFTGEAADGF